MSTKNLSRLVGGSESRSGLDGALGQCGRLGLDTSGNVSDSNSSVSSWRSGKEAANRVHSKRNNSAREGSRSDLKGGNAAVRKEATTPAVADPAKLKADEVAQAAAKVVLTPVEKLDLKYGPYDARVDLCEVKLFMKISEPIVVSDCWSRLKLVNWFGAFAALCLWASFDDKMGGYGLWLATHPLSVKWYLWSVAMMNVAVAASCDLCGLVFTACNHLGLPSWATGLALIVICAYSARERRWGVDTEEWRTHGASRVFRFTTLEYPKELNIDEVNAMAHSGFTAYRTVKISREALAWLKFQKTNKPTSFTQQQYADLLLREFSEGRASHDELFDTASFQHQLLIAKHYMFKLQQGSVEDLIERM